MTYAELFELKMRLTAGAALARIQVGIEHAAHAAFKAMGSDDLTVAQALGLVADAEGRHALLEADLTLAQEECAVCLASGAHPFNATRWAQTCREAVQAHGSGEQFYKKRHVLDDAFRNRFTRMSGEGRIEGRRIYAQAKAEALGARPFNAGVFKSACEAASAEAASGCGLSDILWSKRATTAMDALLSHVDELHLAHAREIASQAGWMDLDEIKAMNDLIEDEGLCSHGLEPDCCPAGCGEY